MGQQTFNSSGSWEAPAGITQATVECWGGGSGGGRGVGWGGDEYTYPGGSGGAYSKKVVTVTPGNTYTVTVGAGGAAAPGAGQTGSNGGDSWFGSTGTVLAKGGGLNQGGQASAGVGDVKYSGGAGGYAEPYEYVYFGGGSSAGTAANGNPSTGSTAPSAPTGGGKGGDGQVSGVPATAATAPGGGGGAGDSLAATAGAAGRVIVTWEEQGVDLTLPSLSVGASLLQADPVTGTEDLLNIDVGATLNLPFFIDNVLPHVFKSHSPIISTAVTSYIEATEYTIPWAEFQRNGFVDGDNLALIISLVCGNNGSSSPNIEVLVGASFATATLLPYSNHTGANPSGSTVAGSSVLFIADYELNENDNIYIGIKAASGTAYFGNYSALILNRDLLGSNYYRFNSTEPGTTSPNTPTVGAQVNLPAGKWLCFAASRWSLANSSDPILLDIYDGSVSYGAVKLEVASSPISLFKNLGTAAYLDLSSPTDISARYSVVTGSSHQIDSVKIIAICLGRFLDSWGVRSTNNLTPAQLGTYYEYAGNSSLVLSKDVPMLSVGFNISHADQVRRISGRTQIGGNDWPASNINPMRVLARGTDSSLRTPFFDIRYGTIAAGTKDVDYDYAENGNISNQNVLEQTAVILPFVLSEPLNVVDLPFLNVAATLNEIFLELQNEVDLPILVTQALLNQPSVGGGIISNVKVLTIDNNTIRVMCDTGELGGRMLMVITRRDDPELTAEQIREAVDKEQ